MSRKGSDYWKGANDGVTRIDRLQLTEFHEAGVLQIGTYSEKLGRPSSQVAIHLDQMTTGEMQQLVSVLVKNIQIEMEHREVVRGRIGLTPNQLTNWLKAFGTGEIKALEPDPTPKMTDEELARRLK